MKSSVPLRQRAMVPCAHFVFLLQLSGFITPAGVGMLAICNTRFRAFPSGTAWQLTGKETTWQVRIFGFCFFFECHHWKASGRDSGNVDCNTVDVTCLVLLALNYFVTFYLCISQ